MFELDAKMTYNRFKMAKAFATSAASDWAADMALTISANKQPPLSSCISFSEGSLRHLIRQMVKQSCIYHS